MRLSPLLILALGCGFLAACTPPMTLEQAQAACRGEGGLLTVFTEQKLTQSGLGPVVEKPGDCIHRDAFGAPMPAPAPPAP